MESTQTKTCQAAEDPEGAEVESNGSQDGSEDGKACGGSTSEDSRKETGNRDEGSSHNGPKKKRSNKTAKLKQSKLDIRREQFLAQVASKVPRGSAITAVQSKLESPPANGSSGLSSLNGLSSCDSSECATCHVSSVGTDDEEYLAEIIREKLADQVEEALLVKDEDLRLQVDDSVEAAGSAPATPGVLADIVDGTADKTGLKGMVSGGNKKKGRKSSSSGKLTANLEESSCGEIVEEAGQKSDNKKGKQGTPGTSEASSPVPAVKGSHSGKNKKGGIQGSRNGEHEQQMNGGTPEVADFAEDDWEMAAEEFSKQVAKVVIEQVGKEPEFPCGSSKVSGGQLSKVLEKPMAAPEYSLRPNQQEGPCPNPRLCAPNGLRPGYTYAGSAFGRARTTERAWRPDDVSRPPTLPPALGQRMGSRGLLGMPDDDGLANVWRVPQLSQQHWPAPSSPSQPACCPICAEELDVTDSSFVPCACGFRLCLFCHHRIAADDGRCPGCRRAYSPDVVNKQPKQSSGWLRP